MRNIARLSIVMGLFTCSLPLLAQDLPNAYTTQQCPPASALHHVAPGQPWVLDEPYKSQGWTVVQEPVANWSRYNSISKKAILSVRIQEEGIYKNTGKTKIVKETADDGTVYENVYSIFEDTGVTYPVSCNYTYIYNPHDNWDNQTVIVKSPYVSSPNAVFESKSFNYQNDCVTGVHTPANCKNQEANWGFVCDTVAGAPEQCQFKVIDVNTPPSDDFLQARKTLIRHLSKKSR